MRYLVTKEIKSDIQVVWILYFQDLVFLFIWIAAGWSLQEIVHSSLQVPYNIFSIVMGIILVLPSATNPKRRQYQSIALCLSQKNAVYYLLRKKKGERSDEKEQHQGYQRKHSYRKLQ